jgi:hypothetical protein
MDIEPQFKQPLQSAVRYAIRGIPVLPLHGVVSGKCTCGVGCGSPGKHPRIQDWASRSSTDPALVSEWWRRWPGSNVGIPTGAPSGLVVLDFDGAAGQKLAHQYGVTADDAVPLSLTGTGMHAFYRWPGVPTRSSVKAIPGLDVRADKALVVLPPSLHVLGRPYAWERPLLDSSAAPPLPWWAPVTQAGRKPPARPQTVMLTEDRVLKLKDHVVGNVVRAQPGTRNNTLNREAYFLAGFVVRGVLSEDEYLGELGWAAGKCGLDQDEIDQTLESALSARVRHEFDL